MIRNSSLFSVSPQRIPTFLRKHKTRYGIRFYSHHEPVGILSNDEVIEGVWIFHRHGDRSPGRPLIAEQMQEQEAQFWRTKIPPIDRSYYHALKDRIPTKINENNNDGKFLDADNGREPYGFLTFKGMNQMHNTGAMISRRYADRKSSQEFLNLFDVKGYSTNYLRTVMSVQCFIDGLLFSSMPSSGKHSYNDLSSERFMETRPSLFSEDDAIIEVRDRKQDTLNAFDKRPQFMKSLVADVVTTPEFIDKDTKAGCIAARLANFLPGLTKASSYGGPSGINWIHAADHFVCRSSHNVAFTSFTHRENDMMAEETMAAMSYYVVSHLAWRFRTWYQYPPLLAAIAAPPLQEIGQQIQRISDDLVNNSNISKKPFRIYSCHDVTILSLLYGIGADFLATNDELIGVGLNPGNEERWRFWPRYASTLVFELVRSKKDSSQKVRILLNGKEVTPLSILRKKKSALNVSDFIELIEELSNNEVEDLSSMTNHGEERDMSNWTG